MNSGHYIEFSAEQAAELAKFLAEIVRQGVTYEVRTIVGGWRVALTGGF